jgi:hypothetical protein
MTEQWKPIGDKWPQPAMVWVRKVNGDLAAISSPFAISVVDSRWVSTKHLHLMPPTITPEQQAVLDAAEVWLSAGWTDRRDHALTDAIRAMLAAQQPPPTPLQTLRAAWDAIQHHGYGDGFVTQMEAAIVALEEKA